MYLKSLEIIGFKSFAQKTRLVFEPGITAVVGPNGCGKSNISDAIRWVLGEQRPTALRGAAMTDVIFNGTEGRKPLGMAEVSITFADCEDKLGTEYNEVTVSRRVFRSGEGQYFLNKVPCRLRDIQRLFMGTGIGTTSYSVMAQGQIDAILSSRPEDRRMVFEEASGITRFKADRKEALRKLDQTDANLLRLADVIREVKRQIGSLQRQAGRARRYSALRKELRALDVYATSRRVADMGARAAVLEKELKGLEAEAAAKQADAEGLEVELAAARERLMEAEREIGRAMETAMQAQGILNEAKGMVRLNEQRIEEYRNWSERDEREIAETQSIHAAQQEALEELADQLTDLETETRKAEAALAEAREAHEQRRGETEAARARLQELRGDLIERERAAARAQTELAEIESRERGTIIERERLAAEKAQLERSVKALGESSNGLEGEVEALEDLVATHEEQFGTLDAQRVRRVAEQKALQQERSALQSRIAARAAQIEMLEDREENADEFPAGTRMLLDPGNPLKTATDGLLGPLADHVSAPPEVRKALEAALRPWLDAVVVRDVAYAAELLAELLALGRPAGTRLVAAEGAEGVKGARASKAEIGLPRLIELVECSAAFRPAAERLLANIFVAPSLAEIPRPVPAGCSFVTGSGALVRDDGCIDLWMPEGAAANPLARRMLAEDAREQLATLELELGKQDERAEELARELSALETQQQGVRRLLDESRRAAAQKSGEFQGSRRDLAKSRERLETVNFEFERVLARSAGGETQKQELAERLKELRDDRERIADATAGLTAELQGLEQRHAQAQAELTEQRLAHASTQQRTEHARMQHRAGIVRLEELTRMMQGRARGLQSYEDSIARLQQEIEAAKQDIPRVMENVERANAQAAALRGTREEREAESGRCEAALAGLRRVLETVRNRRAQAEVQLAELRVRRQNMLDRLETDYHLAESELAREPEPEWPDGEPMEAEEINRRVAELRGQIDALGPVNLVAIEEYREQEERYAFLTAQEEDLVKGKEQILELIKRINTESSALFKETFEKANKNFQMMFEKLFNGGTAQLVLLDSEDVLECGIDIIARPPGKRLQSVSLLSGGERTLTAVSLLFAIYMIKPSPFALLDEMDAALDDANIGRFVQTLKDFLDLSQFLIITHNQHTIAGADIVYGVTMPEKGVSKLVSMRLKQVGVEEPEAEDLGVNEKALPAPPKRRRKASDEEPKEGEGA